MKQYRGIKVISRARVDKGLYWDAGLSLVEGCTPVSSGCGICWSSAATHTRSYQKKNKKIKERYKGLTDRGHFNGRIRLMREDLDKPLSRRRSRVYSIWNDLFHDGVPDSFIIDVFETMAACSQHIFIVLTKRPERMRDFLNHFEWSCSGDKWSEVPAFNVILGTSVEDMGTLRRIDTLKKIPASTRMISFEPLYERIELPPLAFVGIHWAILGVERGYRRLSCSQGNLIDLASRNKNGGSRLFVKQIEVNGAVTSNFSDFPAFLQYREFPEVYLRD